MNRSMRVFIRTTRDGPGKSISRAYVGQDSPTRVCDSSAAREYSSDVGSNSECPTPAVCDSLRTTCAIFPSWRRGCLSRWYIYYWSWGSARVNRSANVDDDRLSYGNGEKNVGGAALLNWLRESLVNWNVTRWDYGSARKSIVVAVNPLR